MDSLHIPKGKQVQIIISHKKYIWAIKEGLCKEAGMRDLYPGQGALAGDRCGIIIRPLPLIKPRHRTPSRHPAETATLASDPYSLEDQVSNFPVP